MLAVGGLGTLLGAYGEKRDRRDARLRSAGERRELRAAFLAERSRLIGPGEG